GTAGVEDIIGTAEHGTTFSYSRDALNQYDRIAHGQAIGNGSEHEISDYQGVYYRYLNDTHLAEASLSATESPAYVCQFGYDALGRRVKTTINNSVNPLAITYYFYDGERPI